MNPIFLDVPVMHDARSNDLPKPGTYVVCRYTGGNWRDTDQEGVVWRVAKFDTCKLGGNNHLPYCWSEFGPHTMFGHDVDLWFELPRRKG